MCASSFLRLLLPCSANSGWCSTGRQFASTAEPDWESSSLGRSCHVIRIQFAAEAGWKNSNDIPACALVYVLVYTFRQCRIDFNCIFLSVEETRAKDHKKIFCDLWDGRHRLTDLFSKVAWFTLRECMAIEAAKWKKWPLAHSRQCT